jgi:hypothetical protein
MELKSQALDRVLEALSPVLAAELDRVVAERREEFEQEFEIRLQQALRDAADAAKAEAEVQKAESQARLDSAVAEAQQLTRQAVTAELEQQFQNTLADTAAQSKAEASAQQARIEEQMDQFKAEASAEQARLQAQIDQWRLFAEAEQRLTEASSQPEILARFLKIVQPFAEGLGLYVSKTDGLALWKSRGNGAFPEIISEETTDPESYFRRILVRNRTVGAICAVPPFNTEALEFLASSLERAIELFGLKLRTPLSKSPMESERIAAIRSQHSSGAK